MDADMPKADLIQNTGARERKKWYLLSHGIFHCGLAEQQKFMMALESIKCNW